MIVEMEMLSVCLSVCLSLSHTHTLDENQIATL